MPAAFYISNISLTASVLHRHLPRSERYKEELLALSSSPNSAKKVDGELFSSGVTKRKYLPSSERYRELSPSKSRESSSTQAPRTDERSENEYASTVFLISTLGACLFGGSSLPSPYSFIVIASSKSLSGCKSGILVT